METIWTFWGCYCFGLIGRKSSSEHSKIQYTLVLSGFNDYNQASARCYKLTLITTINRKISFGNILDLPRIKPGAAESGN